MIKERFNQNKEEELVENFTDDESEDEEDVEGEIINHIHFNYTFAHSEAKICLGLHTDQKDGDDDNEDREQDRMAKHFAKRARRNRILEEYTGDSEFSRSRLIDEDVTMQQDLRTMKVRKTCLNIIAIHPAQVKRTC